jgi:hypothetical protein
MPFSISWDVIRWQSLVIAQKKMTGPSGDDTASNFDSRVSMLISCCRSVFSGKQALYRDLPPFNWPSKARNRCSWSSASRILV